MENYASIVVQSFFDSLCFVKNFAKNLGFPHKTPAQVPHFKTRPGYKLAKKVTSSSSSSITKKKNSNFYFYVNYNGA